MITFNVIVIFSLKNCILIIVACGEEITKKNSDNKLPSVSEIILRGKKIKHDFL